MNRAGYVMLCVAVAFNVGASIALKLGSGHQVSPIETLQHWDKHLKVLLIFAMALGCYGFAFVSYMLTLRSVPVSIAYPMITGLTTLVIAAIAVPLFGESMPIRSMAGIVFILLGATLLSYTN